MAVKEKKKELWKFYFQRAKIQLLFVGEIKSKEASVMSKMYRMKLLDIKKKAPDAV